MNLFKNFYTSKFSSLGINCYLYFIDFFLLFFSPESSSNTKLNSLFSVFLKYSSNLATNPYDNLVGSYLWLMSALYI
jgi:hypothetical protein